MFDCTLTEVEVWADDTSNFRTRWRFYNRMKERKVDAAARQPLVLSKKYFLPNVMQLKENGSFGECLGHMGWEYVSREKKSTMVNFLIFVQKNVSTIRFQEIKIRPFQDFEKMRFLCFYIIKSMARKGYFGPKSDFRGSKIPPRGASSTWNM